MKKILSLLLVLSAVLCMLPLSAAAIGDLPISSKNFPDKAFREYIGEEFDSDKDGSLSEKEIAAVTQIFCEDRGIRSLDGIEYFSELMNLSCDRNEIETLDLGKNLELSSISCSSNRITELVLPDAEYLHSLSCVDNLLAELDLSEIQEMVFLDCRYNRIAELELPTDRLFSLEVSGNPLKELDIPDYPSLETLICTGCGLEELDVSGLPALYHIDCSGNEIESLELSANNSLYGLYCSDNKLKTLDLSKNKNLGALDFSNNSGIQELYTSPEADIYTLICRNCGLEGIGLEAFPHLSYLDCSGNDISQLDLSNNENLCFLYCSGNELESLDVSACSMLTELVWRGGDAKNVLLPENDGAQYWETGLELALDPVKNAEGAKGDKFNGYGADMDKNGNLLINEENFPDRQFRLWLTENYDKACRGYLSAEQIAQISFLSIENEVSSPFEIMSLQGIEFFSSIIRFESGELLPTEIVDLTENTELYKVNLGGYLLEELYLPQTEKLRSVYVLSDKLSSLDVSGCTNLEDLVVYGPVRENVKLPRNVDIRF